MKRVSGLKTKRVSGLVSLILLILIGFSYCVREPSYVLEDSSVGNDVVADAKSEDSIMNAIDKVKPADNENILTWTNYNSGNSGLPSNIVAPIVIDANNNIWMASYYINVFVTGSIGTGVSKFDGTNWTTFTTADGLAADMILSIATDAHGTMWFGTEGGGVSKFDGSSWTTYTNPNGSASNYITSIAIDAQDNMWFGSWGGGVSKFDGLSWTTYTTADGLANNQVTSIVIEDQSCIWIGTVGGGVSKFDGKSWTNYNTNIIYSRNGLTVNSIAIDAQGNKWFGTKEDGILKFDGTNWTTYPFKTFGNITWSVDQPVHSIVIDALGNKWFGGNFGVTKFDGATWTTYNDANGLALNLVCAIAIDDIGNKWMGTYGGGVFKLSSEYK